MTTVPVVPGGRIYRSSSLSVTENGLLASRGARIPGPTPPIPVPRSQSVKTGVDRAIVIALLGFCLIADGAALILCARLFGGS